MSLYFKEEGHIYKSLEDDIQWTSVTSFIGKFKKPFDAKGVANKVSKNKKSKWYGIPPEKILDIWKAEGERATTLGTWYHNQRENDIISLGEMERNGLVVPIIKPIIEDGVKYAPEQKLKDGIYPEHFVYLKSAGICGQIDYLEVVNSIINIKDYKTNKEIKTESYVNWEGISDKMAAPLNHLDDCNFYHYALQMSIYAYIVHKHNPRLKVGKLTLQHVKFKQLGEDINGYPIYEQDNGEPVVESTELYDVPYLKKEVIDLIHYKKEMNGTL